MPVQLLQKHDLTECPLRICRIMEGVEYFFKGDDSLELAVDGLPYNTICTLTQLLNDFVFFENVRFDLFSHCFRKYLFITLKTLIIKYYFKSNTKITLLKEKTLHKVTST